MNNLMKRSLALLTALFLCLSLLPTTLVTVDAADYIYNWGTRGTIATSLSENAQAFYTGSNTYDALATLSGGASTDTVPNSDLYNALQTLMKDAHSYETSYDGTRDLYQYTDCQNGGGAISSFYSGAEIGPDWDSGATWNREHTWPNSKGLGGNDENDIMMLRPTSVSENSSRGNKAYGESADYYNPNSESGGAYDVRGDVARIFLYVYVRWGNVSGNGEYATWGSNGVMESPEVMLNWMQADPVDTWEMGRNDSVQSITGTRNVFVDYPELAFLLFSEDVPADMTTPANKAAECQHNYVDGTCSICGAEKPVVNLTTTATLSFATTAQRTELSTTKQVWKQNGITFTNEKASSSSDVADYSDPVRLYKNSSVKIEYPGMTQIVFTCSGSSYATALGNAITGAAVNDKEVTVTFAEPQDSFEIAALSGGATRLNSITVTSISTDAGCEHTNTTIEGAKDATCTETGHTGKTVCSDCGETVDAGEDIPVTDHTYVDGACSACGAKDLSSFETATATITFDDAAKRTEQDAEHQVWVENGITVTNNKAASSSDVVDSVAPVKFYAHSSLNVAYPGMTQIEFACNTTGYATALKNSITDAVVTVSEKVVTVIFADPTDSLDIDDMSAQVRVDSITVTAISCKHADTKVEDAVDATCTTEGHTGKTVCNTCGGTISEGEVIAATGHTYVDGTCSACGEKEPATATSATITFDDTSKRTTFDTTQQIWAENGITVTNLKASSTTNVADYSAPARFYKSSSLKVEYPGMTKIEFACNTAAYATALAGSISNATVATNDKVVTVTLEAPQDVFEIAALGGQIRMDSITVTASAEETPDESVCEHTNTTAGVDKVDATCTTEGHTGKTVCADCGETVDAGEVIAKRAHSFVDGACSVCGVKAPETSLATSQAYKFGMTQENLENKIYYLAGGMNGYYMATTEDADAAIEVYVEETEGGYYFYTYVNSVKHYINMVVSGTYVNGAYETTASTVYTFDAEKGTLIANVNNADYWFGTRNDGTYTTMGPCAVSYNGFYGKFYKFVEGNPNEPTCQHTNTAVGVDKVEATCTAEGHTGKTVCNDCGVTVNPGEVTEMLEHNYVDGVCSACGAEEPAATTTVTITFDDTSKRTAFDTTQQIWVENGITVTNLKASSTTNVADYSAPARFYKSSSLKVEYPGMTKIEFACNTAAYATALAGSISNATVATNDKVVTVTLEAPQDVFEIAALGSQIRMDSITVTVSSEETPEEPVCEEHSFVDGVCSACGHKLGDINGDGTVTYQDAVYMLLANMFPGQYTLDGVYADVNGDGIIDVNDAVYLLLHVLFGNLFYPLRTAVVG